MAATGSLPLAVAAALLVAAAPAWAHTLELHRAQALVRAKELSWARELHGRQRVEWVRCRHDGHRSSAWCKARVWTDDPWVGTCVDRTRVQWRAGAWRVRFRWGACLTPVKALPETP